MTIQKTIRGLLRLAEEHKGHKDYDALISAVDLLNEYAVAGSEYNASNLEKPCNIGDVVYALRYKYSYGEGKKTSGFVHNIGIKHFRSLCEYDDITISVCERKCMKADLYHIGKRIFLSREEAEAAMLKYNK